MRFMPLQLTQSVEEGETPADLGWKCLGPLRILDVEADSVGNVAMEFGSGNTHVKLVASKSGGITVYRNDMELVEATP